MEDLEQKIFEYMKSHEEDIIADIITLCSAESPTNSKEYVDRCGRVLAGLYMDRLGAESVFMPQTVTGDNIVTEIGEGGRRLMIVGHFDTVHPVGTVPVRREGRILYGPGAYDMKGGDIAVIWALKCLNDLGIPINKRITIVNNSDEEIGSPNSKPLLLEKAKGACTCIVAEPAAPGGLIKVSRKGGGKITIRCYGKAAHAGSNPQDGVNANIELAHQIIFVQGLSDYGPGGSTFCPNLISGGTAGNVVSAYAEAKVDWRMCTIPELERGLRIFAERKAVTSGARVEFDVIISHPPMVQTEASRELYSLLEACAADLDMKVASAPMVGGCSDGNDISAEGVPTIDGMGMIGNYMHNPNEQIYLDELAPKTALLASFISRI